MVLRRTLKHFKSTLNLVFTEGPKERGEKLYSLRFDIHLFLSIVLGTRYKNKSSFIIHKTVFFPQSLRFYFPYEKPKSTNTCITLKHLQAFAQSCVKEKNPDSVKSELVVLLLLCSRTNTLRINDANERCGKTKNNATSSSAMTSLPIS